MGTQSTRLPDDLEKYLRIIIANGYAKSESDAIRNIVLERYLNDKEAGNVRPFSMNLRDRRTKAPDLSKLNIEGIEEVREASEDAPHLEEPTAPLKTPVPADAENKTTRLKRTKRRKAIDCEKCGRPREIMFTDGIAWYGCPCGHHAQVMKGANTYEVPDDYEFDNQKEGPTFGPMGKPAYPGTMEQYETDPKKAIFEPPKE